jgi:RES domain-containing protein
MQAGESWLLSMVSALLVVPSVIVPEGSNALINPAHPDADLIVAMALLKWHYDSCSGLMSPDTSIGG